MTQRVSILKKLESIGLYPILGGFIAIWWILAFHSYTPTDVTISPIISQSLTLKTSHLLEELSLFERESLQRALAGQFNLMTELIDQWDQDARCLIKRGIDGIQRLSEEKYLQAHLLGQLLQHSSPELIHTLNRKMNLKAVQDDHGRLVKIKDTFNRFLPQTYVTASFLLAIAPPQEIIALPKGLRRLQQLHNTKSLVHIPHDIDRTSSEKLYLAQPNLAFVAPYSHPPALEVLNKQGIQLFTIKHIDTLENIQQALLKVGHTSNHILEAQLLALFMEACLLSVDNRFHALQELLDPAQAPNRVLCLYFHQHYMLPTTRCLTGQLLARMMQHYPSLTCPIVQSEEEWRIPFEQEKLLQINPDCLIISSPCLNNSQHVSNLPHAIHDLDAYKLHRIFFVDEVIQESPTQYIALAYYDIYQAIAASHCL